MPRRPELRRGLWRVVMLCLWPWLAQASAPEMPDFSGLRVYGVSRPALQSVEEARAFLAAERGPDGRWSAAAEAELYRFLVYDALNQYVGYLLGLVDKPDEGYFGQFAPLAEPLGGDVLSARQRQAVREAVDLAGRIRFDVALVKIATRTLHNRPAGAEPDAAVRELMQRLVNVAARLAELHPDGQGELPPVLVAFAASFFQPMGAQVPVSCRNPLPEQLKSSVLQTLRPGPDRPRPD